MLKLSSKRILMGALSACLCSGCESGNVQGYFSQLPTSSSSSSNTTIAPPGNSGTQTSTITLKTIQPAFAVRGLNCMACHGVIGSNVITDFGFTSENFTTMFAPLPGMDNNNSGRTAFNDIDSGGPGGWQEVQITGSVHVPKVNFSAAEASIDFGMSTATTFATMLQTPNIGGQSTSMAAGITPLPGQSAIIEDSVISIKYPSQAELVALLPSNLQTAAAAVALIPLPGVSINSQTGLAVDSSGKYVKNTQSSITCYGDVAIKGPLFLNNMNLTTDTNGCRLYVAGSVFIQGPITHANGTASNLQITSSRGVLMGFSTVQMGALQSPAASGAVSQIRVPNQGDAAVLTAGGPYARFAVEFDEQYNPSGADINGVASTTFFDDLVSDALLIGAPLIDAGEPAAFNNLIAGESLVTETNENNDQGSYGGKRVAIDYTGLLLNAPHIHSRYGGSFSGVIIGDVAMLARNPDNTNSIEQYHYDQRFNTVPAILPALTTTILDVEN